MRRDADTIVEIANENAMEDAGCRMQDAGCRMQDAGCRMQDAGGRMEDER